MQRIRHATAYNLASILVNSGGAMLLVIVAARSWSTEQFASYIYLTLFAATMSIFVSTAFPALAVRMVAESLARGESGRARRIILRMAVCVTAIGAVLSLVVVGLQQTGSGLGLGGSALAVAFLACVQAGAGLVSYATQGARRFDRVLYGNLATVLPATLATCAAIRAGAGLTTVIAILGLGHFGLIVWLALGLKAELAAGPDGGGPALAEVRPYFVFVATINLLDMVVWQKSEVFFLQRYHPGLAVALYGVAFPLAFAVLRTAPNALAGVLTPAFAGLHGVGELARARPLYGRAVTAMAAASMMLGIGAVGLGPSLLRLWGDDYVAAYPMLPWLVLGLALGNIAGVASAIFHGFDRADLLLKTGVILAALNIALDFLLIPTFGAFGAAWSCAAAQALSLPLTAFFLYRGLGVAPPWKPLLRVATSATLAGASAYTMKSALSASVAADVGVTIVAVVVALATYLIVGGRRDLRDHTEIIDPPTPDATDPDDSPLVSVVIPTKNRPSYVERTLERLASHDGPRHEIVVADGSDDECSAELIRERFPNVRLVLIRGPHNIPFARNQAIRHARGQILCFLDDDSMVEPGWMERLVAHYENESVGAVGGRIVDQIFARAQAGETIGRVEPNGRIHLNFTHHPGAVIEVDHMIGCNMSFRAAAIAAVDGFDAHFDGPSFMEETDLCLRVRGAGYRILFDPDAVVHHTNAPRDKGMKRDEALDPRAQFWSARSRAYFALKQLPRTFAVVRHNALGNLKLHAIEAWRQRSWGHVRAIILQSSGLLLGSVDWLRAGRPRVKPIA